MNIRLLFIILTLLANSASVFAQSTAAAADTALTREDAKISPTDLAKAKFQINDIKTRGIIVRLKTNKDRIAAYRKDGYNKVADKLEERSRLTNTRLMFAFIKEWNYSPVYFMESQHSQALLLHDSLIAKTYDLKRDTLIHMSRDSFYLVDYGDLMGSDPIAGEAHHMQESVTPVANEALVVKNHAQQQLQVPMPYYGAIGWGGTFNTDLERNIETGQKIADEVKRDNISGDSSVAREALVKSENMASQSPFDRLSGYLSRQQVSKTPLHKDSVNKYIDRIYDYMMENNYSDKFSRTAARLNNKFIAYYCRRLLRDRDLICSDEPIYWWHRNPNIRYLPAIPALRQELSSSALKESKPSTKKR